jgi:penicillin-binding protein-related factor A (putative recombinase)
MKQNHLDELPIAKLTDEQLRHLKATEEQLNREGRGVYLIAFEKQAPSQ